MSKHAPWILPLLIAAGCTKASSTTTSERERGVAKPSPSTVTLTSVAFADDCGGTPPLGAPAPIVRTAAAPAADVMPAKPAQEPASPAAIAANEVVQGAPARRRCEQTSMQLAISSSVASELHIKSVEVFDDAGTSLGSLSASKPTRWVEASAAYEPWDEKVAAGAAMSVSYVLSQPAFVDRYDARDRTYTVKVVATIGGADQPLKTTVMVVGRPAPVPT